MIDYFSGIQPSGGGNLHLGNYFGAILPQIELAKSGKSCLYFIADVHSLTSTFDGKQLSKNILSVAATYMALGLPESIPLFKQSDIPDVGLLSFILSCQLGSGHLERMHAYKDKVANGLPASFGLMSYPALMAADILMYGPKYVPVGQDQDQHLQLTQQAARSFNEIYGDTFVIPEAFHSETPKILGTDGQKMSKTYGNQIDIFASDLELKKQLKKIVTDSRPVEESKTPNFPLAQLLYLFLNKEEQSDLTDRLAAGKVGYGELKVLLAEKIKERFSNARGQYIYLTETPQGNAEIKQRLESGRVFAKTIANATMLKVYNKVGLSI